MIIDFEAARARRREEDALHTEPAYLTARINAPIQPIDRGDQFEDPLEVLLKEDGLGEVTGGGTMLGEDGTIAFCDVEFEVLNDATETLSAVRRVLDEIGLPKGSMLIVESDRAEGVREIPVGTHEGMAIYLNAADLPAEVYETCDIEEVIEEVSRRLNGVGLYRSYRSTPSAFILYLYGPSFEAMQDRLADYMESYPLFEGARVEQIV